MLTTMSWHMVWYKARFRTWCWPLYAANRSLGPAISKVRAPSLENQAINSLNWMSKPSNLIDRQLSSRAQYSCRPSLQCQILKLTWLCKEDFILYALAVWPEDETRPFCILRKKSFSNKFLRESRPMRKCRNEILN